MENKKKSKIKMPLLFRIIRWVFPKLELILPNLAGKLAKRLFFHPFRFKTPEGEIVWQNQAKKDHILVAGKKVITMSFGEGEPVILSHGWSGRGTQFWKFIEVFTSNGFQVITYDAPAHGQSTGRETSVIEFAEVIRQLSDKYKPEILIGHSLGGVASLLAITQGVSVKNLVMIGSPSVPEYLISEFLERINGTQQSFKHIKEYVHQRTGRSFEDFMVSNLLNNVSNLNLLVVHDENDKEVPFVHALKTKEKYPEARLYKTKGLGHNRILKDQQVVEDVMRFTKDSVLSHALKSA